MQPGAQGGHNLALPTVERDGVCSVVGVWSLCEWRGEDENKSPEHNRKWNESAVAGQRGEGMTEASLPCCSWVRREGAAVPTGEHLPRPSAQKPWLDLPQRQRENKTSPASHLCLLVFTRQCDLQLYSDRLACTADRRWRRRRS